MPPAIPPSAQPPQPVETLSYFNPAAPTSPIAAWRIGKTLIIAQGAVLPDRCVKCNIATQPPRYRQQITWYPWYLLLFFAVPLGPIVWLILYLVLKKTMPLDFAVCPRHRRQRRARIALAVVVMLAGIYAIIFSVAHEKLSFLYLGFLLITAAFIASAARILRPLKIDARQGYFRGAGPEFLNSLPGLATQPT